MITKNKVNFGLFILSIFLFPIFIFLLWIWFPNSSFYYTSNFFDYKEQFIRASEFKLKGTTDDQFQKMQQSLFQTYRVDSIDSNILNEKIYVSFSLSDSYYYPSTESEYRMIIYQPEDELPIIFKKYYNRRICENWFYVTNSYGSIYICFILLIMLIFLLSVWVTRIIHAYKMHKRS